MCVLKTGSAGTLAGESPQWLLKLAGKGAGAPSAAFG